MKTLRQQLTEIALYGAPVRGARMRLFAWGCELMYMGAALRSTWRIKVGSWAMRLSRFGKPRIRWAPHGQPKWWDNDQ